MNGRTLAEQAVISRIIRWAREIAARKQENPAFNTPDYSTRVVENPEEEQVVVREKGREVLSATRKRKVKDGNPGEWSAWKIKTQLSDTGCFTLAAEMEQQFRRAVFDIKNALNRPSREKAHDVRTQARAEQEAQAAEQLRQQG